MLGPPLKNVNTNRSKLNAFQGVWEDPRTEFRPPHDQKKKKKKENELRIFIVRFWLRDKYFR